MADMLPTLNVEESIFARRLRIATYSVLLLVLIIYLLKEFRDVLQPLFIAFFLSFLMQPIHRWLVRQRIPSVLAYVVILILVGLAVLAFGTMMYANATLVSEKMLGYEDRLERMILSAKDRLPFQTPQLEGRFLRKIVTPEQMFTVLGRGLGHFGDFTSLALLSFVYLIFLIAEKVNYPQRLTLAFGDVHGARIMSVAESINQAIGDYIAVKTLVSALAGVLSYAVLAAFDIEFAGMCGILIFLLNYIPYLGSLIAVGVPIVLSFIQFDDAWRGIIVTIALIAIQQIIGTLIEPRMTGKRLGVSPLLILLSLSFWWFILGIVGAILAVPFLVIVKIIFDNIPETKPLATMMSNQ